MKTESATEDFIRHVVELTAVCSQKPPNPDVVADSFLYTRVRAIRVDVGRLSEQERIDISEVLDAAWRQLHKDGVHVHIRLWIAWELIQLAIVRKK